MTSRKYVAADISTTNDRLTVADICADLDIGRRTAGLQLFKVPEVMRMLKMSRTVIFEQLRDGSLRSVRQGRARLIPAGAIAEYIALLEREEAERNAA
jgi:hypothetical protein